MNLHSDNLKLHIVIIVLIAGLFFIPFLDRVHLFDWDEANFAEASREMIEQNNYMRVTINYKPFWEKPPLFFWLQAGSMKIFGVNEFSARFVNAIWGILTLLLVYLVGRTIYDWKFGVLWALTFFGSFLPHLFFKSGIIDPVFNFFIFSSLAMLFFGINQSKKSLRYVSMILAGFLIGLAILAKGPVAFLILSLTGFIYFLFSRKQNQFSIGEISVFLLSCVFVALLFFGIETIRHGTWFITEFTKYQIRLFRTGDAGHGRPFYFHFFVNLFGCFPASFFAIRSFFTRYTPNKHHQLFARLILILFWVVLILFSIVKTKTVLYSSMLYYPITYLAALHIYGLVEGKLKWNKMLGVSLVIFSLLIAITITLFPLLLKFKDFWIHLVKDKHAYANLQLPLQWHYWEALVGIGYGMMITLALFMFLKKNYVRGITTMFLSSALVLELFMFQFAPKVEQYTQGGPIAFYKAYANQDVYIRSLFRSYADLFYGKKKLSDREESRSLDWLLTGQIDKPVVFVSKSKQMKKYMSEPYNLKLLKEEYGFAYYRRDP